MTKTITKKKAPKPTTASDYPVLLGGVSDLLESARRASARAVNAVMTATYWEIGRRIVEFEQEGKPRAEYGEEVLKRLSEDLTTRFGRGYSRFNLVRFRQFYLAAPADQIRATLSLKSPEGKAVGSTRNPSSVVIDEDNPTTFQSEFLLNEAGRLEIHKTFSGHLASPKCTSISAYAVHPTTSGLADLLQLKNSELKKRAEKLNVDLSGIDPKVNAQVRRRIRDWVKELQLRPVLIPLNEEKTARPWEQLKAYVPILALFTIAEDMGGGQ